ncbi:PH domain-containing protein [Nocardioides aurantiacus]|uniref:YdbS-like PH domain-containing protein n=1 Tax=Nocardioides aurantiacus TaxID=86796 RepID=A0A3N2CZI3_9ACTN|nr:PH domain-containing protein [Nocardioides aurantiacus]ROR92818.1 hypothetical protein EDD33_3718 [Nocardioides aurantiacus]
MSTTEPAEDPFAAPDATTDAGSVSGDAPVLRLRPPRHRVSSRAPVMWALGSLFGDLLVLAALLVVRWFDWFDLAWWVWALLGVNVVVGVVVSPLVRYRVHRWESTDSAVYTQSGWLSLERRIAPMAKVQTVDVEQGAFARLLGLATVTVTTASAAGPVKIEGIESATADRLVAELTRRTTAEAGDAT